MEQRRSPSFPSLQFSLPGALGGLRAAADNVRASGLALLTPPNPFATAPGTSPPNELAITADAHAGGRLPRKNFNGSWIKDKGRSDNMEEAMTLAGLNGIVRTAVKLIKGVNIQQDEGTFEMAVFSAIPLLKVKERYTLDGKPTLNRRRDLRSGKHEGVASTLPNGDLKLDLTWGAPYAGHGIDVISQPAPDEMHIQSTNVIEGKSVSYRSIYTRKK